MTPYSSDRSFGLECYTASHSQLLFTAWRDDRHDEPDYVVDPEWEDPLGPRTRIDLLFKPVVALRVRRSYRGLSIRKATPDTAAAIKASYPSIRFDGDHQVFLLDSEGEQDHIVATAFAWHEDERDNGAPSHFRL